MCNYAPSGQTMRARGSSGGSHGSTLIKARLRLARCLSRGPWNARNVRSPVARRLRSYAPPAGLPFPLATFISRPTSVAANVIREETTTTLMKVFCCLF